MRVARCGQLFEHGPEQRILAKDAEGGGIGAHDQTLLVRQDDPVAERDEGLGEGRLVEGGIFAPAPGDPTSFRGR